MTPAALRVENMRQPCIDYIGANSTTKRTRADAMERVKRIMEYLWHRADRDGRVTYVGAFGASRRRLAAKQ
jgi:hypothetical protein